MKKIVLRLWIAVVLFSLYPNVWEMQNVSFAMTQQKSSISYEYDVLGRVIRVIYPDGRELCYEYDDNGNIVNNTVESGGEHTQQGTTSEDSKIESGMNKKSSQVKVGGYKKLDISSYQLECIGELTTSPQDKKAYEKFKKKKLVIKSLKVKKNKKKYYLSIQIKKINGMDSYGEFGYEIKYATNRKFKNGKTICVNKTGSVTGTDWKVKNGRQYWVKVRAYMKTKAGKSIYSKYSKVKKIKVE